MANIEIRQNRHRRLYAHMAKPIMSQLLLMTTVLKPEHASSDGLELTEHIPQGHKPFPDGYPRSRRNHPLWRSHRLCGNGDIPRGS
ncbi:hypothetical protein KCP69_06375 [Salmonella enterica subsp. enterica]|nr:hypothetical protein KCP69_06375 [Salmonella enterica subsp. enterica]